MIPASPYSENQFGQLEGSLKQIRGSVSPEMANGSKVPLFDHGLMCHGVMVKTDIWVIVLLAANLATVNVIPAGFVLRLTNLSMVKNILCDMVLVTIHH